MVLKKIIIDILNWTFASIFPAIKYFSQAFEVFWKLSRLLGAYKDSKAFKVYESSQKISRVHKSSQKLSKAF